LRRKLVWRRNDALPTSGYENRLFHLVAANYLAVNAIPDAAGLPTMKPRKHEIACEFCGEIDHHTHQCPDLPSGWHPPKPRKMSFHRAAVEGKPERIEHEHGE